MKNLEFVTRSKYNYVFWKIDDLMLKFQEGSKEVWVDHKPDPDKP